MVADTRIYLGRPGNLGALRSPRGTFEAPRQRRTSSFELGIGGTAVDQMIGGARTYVINYEMLERNDWTTLQAYLDGLEGPGPFVLLDPGQRNMLPANIAGATSVTNSTDGGPTGSFDLVGVLDDYNRAPVASGWGSTITGQAWTTSPSANHTATGSVGTQSVGSVNAFRTAVVDTGSTDFDITVDAALSVGVPTGAAIAQWVCGRYSDASNHYIARLTMSPTGIVTIALFRRSGGTLSSALGTGTVTVAATHQADEVWRIHFTGTGTALAASAWLRDTGTEPAAPTVTATDATLTTGTSIALMTRLESGNTDALPVVSTWDNLDAAPSGVALTSSTAYTDAGPRVLAATFTAAPTGGIGIVIDWPSSTFTYGVPVVAGRALCFSCYVRGGGSDPITTWTPRIVWKDATGAVVSTVTTGSGAVASASGAWAQLYATGTPPATTVYADMDVQYTSGATSGAVAYFRRFMLNEGSEPDTAWAVGTGVWPVRMVAGTEGWPFLSPELREAPVVAFQEDVS